MCRADSKASPDRGLVQSAQLALLVPPLLFALFATVQAGIWLAGQSTVQQAAMAAAEHAALIDAGAASAELVATGVADRGGLTGIGVEVLAGGDAVEVRVAAQVPALLPGDWSQVSASAYRAKER